MPYFRYSFLNRLRDELYLTQTYQKVTLFHFLQLGMPAAGLGAGMGAGKGAHSWATGIIVGTIGCGAGLLAAWALPRVLWNMLRLFVRKGWFLLPGPQQSDNRPTWPIVTLDEFATRCKAFNREESRGIFLFFAPMIGILSCLAGLAFYIDRAKPSLWVQVIAAIAIFSALIGFFVLPFRIERQRFRKHGLLCPACGKKITDTAGLVRVPEMGRCKHCGAQVASIADQDSLAQ